MDVVWSRREATVRAVHEDLNARGEKTRAYTTIMTVMHRLDSKEFLCRRREGRTDLYAPRVSREEYQQARVAAEIDELVEQYGDVALTHFARAVASLDPARRRQLARMARRG